MKKLQLAVITLIIISTGALAQVKFNPNDVGYHKTRYIFEGAPKIDESDSEGNLTGSPTIRAVYGSTFKVLEKIADTYLIEFDTPVARTFDGKGTTDFKENFTRTFVVTEIQDTVAYTLNKDGKAIQQTTIQTVKTNVYFIISEADIALYAVKYDPKEPWEFAYGTITYLAKMRGKTNGIPGSWSNDVNLGLNAGIRRNIGENFGLSALLGVGITSVQLDSISTRGVAKASTKKPALTPNLSILFTYKMVSLGFGAGLDWVYEDTPEAQAWVYNNKLFFAVGFGINIFSSSSHTTATSVQEK